MKRCVFLLVFSSAIHAGAQDAEQKPDEAAGLPMEGEIAWTRGPGNGPIGDQAAIKVPSGYIYTGRDGTRKLMEAMHNPLNDTELGMIAPADMEWFVVFEFEECGYVKDDERNDLDVDEMLKVLKEGNKHGNEERKKRGWEPIELVG